MHSIVNHDKTVNSCITFLSVNLKFSVFLTKPNTTIVNTSLIVDITLNIINRHS